MLTLFFAVFAGAFAPQAAGVIHTDFERGFIKAEICSFQDFKKLHNGEKSMAKLKDAGRYRQEGKSYVMEVSERSERAFWKARILAMKCAK